MSNSTFYRYLTLAEQRHLLATIRQFAAIESRRDAAWITLMLKTGIRVEAMSLYTCGDARLALSTRDFYLRAEIQKGSRAHRLVLVRAARGALIELLRVRKLQGHVEDADAPLVMSRNHRGLSVRSYQVRLRYWAEIADLPCASEISPHWLRHTVAKRVLENSTDPDPMRIVQAVLGHANRGTTAMYTRPDREAVSNQLHAALA